MLAVPYAAPVAQWIEHVPSKYVAVGSNPAGRVTVHNPPLSVAQMWYPFKTNKFFFMQGIDETCLEMG